MILRDFSADGACVYQIETYEGDCVRIGLRDDVDAITNTGNKHTYDRLFKYTSVFSMGSG